MNIFLVYPPQGDPTQPYLSMPSLKAFLHGKGYSNVVQRDLNIEAYDYLASKLYIEGAIKRINLCYQELKGKNGLSEDEYKKLQTLAYSITMAPYIIKNIEDAKECFRKQDRFYHYPDYLKASYILQRALEIASSEFFPTRFTTYSFIMGYSTEVIEQVLAATIDERENIFIPFFKKEILPSIFKRKPDFIGISITYDSQLIPGLTLAKLIKEELLHTHVSIGGGYVSNIHHIIEKEEKLFQFVDSYIVHEGETAILNLLYMIEGKEHKCGSMSNVIWYDRKNRKICRGKNKYIEDINNLPAPDFDGLSLERYLSPETVLLLDIERGCYWGKCSFCSYGVGIGPCSDYRPRDSRIIAEIIKNYKEKYRIRHIVFSTDAAAPAHLEKISEEFISNKIDIKWHCTSRVEKSFTLERCRRLKEGGCSHIIFGVESGNQRVLNLMDKGVTLEAIKEVFKRLKEVGITHKSMFMVGFPSENWDEALDTRDFIINNQDLFSFVSLEPFALLKDSIVYRDPDKFGVNRLWQTEGKDLSFAYEFETSKGMDRKEIQEAYIIIWNCLQPIFHGRCYPFIESGASTHTLLYVARYEIDIPFPKNLYKTRYRDMERRFLLKLKPRLSSELFIIEHPSFLFYRTNPNENNMERLDVGVLSGEIINTVYNISSDTVFVLDHIAKNLISQLNGKLTIAEVMKSIPYLLEEKTLNLLRYMLFVGLLVEDV